MIGKRSGFPPYPHQVGITEFLPLDGGICTRCGGYIHPNNDGHCIHLRVSKGRNGKNDYTFSFWGGDKCHFLPVYDSDGNLICEGMPEIAQYIEGIPKVEDVSYDNSLEPRYREAYEFQCRAFGKNGKPKIYTEINADTGRTTHHGQGLIP